MGLSEPTIKEMRLKKGLTQMELAELTGIPRGRINAWEQRGTIPRADDYLKIQVVLNDKFVPRETFISEEPETEDGIKKGIVMAPKGKFAKKTPGGRINFYDTDFAAGDVDFYDDNNTITPAYEMDIPEFAGCTAFRTYGDSMEPMVKSGSILFGTKLEDWQSHLEYGQIYGIVCKDKRKYLKYIRKDKNNPITHYLLRSENIEYDEFELPKNKIKHIWLIHGWINKRS